MDLGESGGRFIREDKNVECARPEIVPGKIWHAAASRFIGSFRVAGEELTEIPRYLGQ